jgi:glutathione synthase/RimK-type ligase-like ATP-grasp enzyme
VQDLKSQAMVRLVSSDLEELIQSSLARIQSDKFTLSIYFGRNLAKRYDRLSLHLFNLVQSPMMRAQFVRDKKWVLRSIATISAGEVPASHRNFVVKVAQEHFAGRGGRVRKHNRWRYDLAILRNPSEAEPPSDEKALRRFVRAAESLGMATELISRDDYARVPEFDALFIRETTAVNHYTYRFARRAANEGLVVMDDPESIVKCTNKVYLAELLSRHKVATPRTVVAHRENVHEIGEKLGFPVVLKKPDSAFSHGVVKVETPEELQIQVEKFLSASELIVAQEFVPTTFDWRIGIIDQRPIFACKYYMADHHWQIIRQDRTGDSRYGKAETLPVELAPRAAVRTALKAANLIGDGFYGVDVKQSEGKFYVIEVNDNPNVDSGVEDGVLKEDLYRRIMEVFLRRIEQRKSGHAAP